MTTTSPHDPVDEGRGSAARDLGDYVAQYGTLPFEPLQAAARRRRVLARVAYRAPRRLLEIGCGHAPLFTDLTGLETVVVEPAGEFVEIARRAASAQPDVTVVQGYAEDAVADLGTFDMVVLSSLLHEVPDPRRLLAAVRATCRADTTVHINVPNARSLHRLLAVAMGLHEVPGSLSDTQRRMQQRQTYDLDSLREELDAAGFTVQEWGSVLVKPFPHAAMQELVETGFLTTELLAGLEALADTLPDIGSELWVDAVARDD